MHTEFVKAVVIDITIQELTADGRSFISDWIFSFGTRDFFLVLENTLIHIFFEIITQSSSITSWTD